LGSLVSCALIGNRRNWHWVANPPRDAILPHGRYQSVLAAAGEEVQKPKLPAEMH
jgi:hypothetical protein